MNNKTRIRGRKLQTLRAKFFSKNPLCQCSDRSCPHYKQNPDHVALACILDHIVPLAQGGANAEKNYQALCVECSDFKSTTERGMTPKPFQNGLQSADLREKRGSSISRCRF